MLRRAGLWMQIDILSYGDGCGAPDSYGVYTRAGQYNQWIAQKPVPGRDVQRVVPETATDRTCS